jgi:transcriptional regulator with XRE-family HTH domain
MDPVTKRFGQRLKALRLARGWTQDQLGRAAGLDPKHIGVVERGKKSSSFETVAKLAAALKADMHELFLPDGGSMSRVIQKSDPTVRLRNMPRADMEKFLRELQTSMQRILRE